MRKQSKETIPKLKRKAWVQFSAFIRLRDCKKTTGTYHKGLCYTCGREYDYKFLQAGHFIPGRRASYLFDEEQTRAQCYVCNCCDHGRPFDYEEKMVAEFGREKVEEFKRRRHDVHKWTRQELIDLGEKYKKKVLELGNLL